MDDFLTQQADEFVAPFEPSEIDYADGTCETCTGLTFDGVCDHCEGLVA